MTTRLGMIVRADRGGLATQTFEVARHMKPDAVLLVDLGDGGRGPTDTTKFSFVPEVRVVQHHEVRTNDAEWLCERADVVYAAEGFQGPYFLPVAQRTGTKTVLHVNPELWDDTHRADVLAVPTHWEQHRIPDAVSLPMPVATDRFNPRLRHKVRDWAHISAPAVGDREGTDFVREAVTRLRAPCTVWLRVPEDVSASKVVDLRKIESYPADYAELWDDTFDAVVMPRRYGGLSLLMAEAMACGLCVLTADREPMRTWLPPEALLSSTYVRQRRMKGGTFEVHQFDAAELARRMDAITNEPELARKLSAASLSWAYANSWVVLRDTWRKVLLDG